ncbi:phage tail protein [Kordiimonas sp. SCSIO 12610]|uniref:phage tail protein n=1 Tax=Kordiimonas sp. SCSIO 12610 TaxID=2829597 RepID=UPI00210B8EB1|nr:phage tail protein [Kordiimonas sp. SCSIO 12610]UTW56197.1 hypothetical protein KFF44_04675 [Kordiimonas sp. SCSIO 12610]
MGKIVKTTLFFAAAAAIVVATGGAGAGLLGASLTTAGTLGVGLTTGAAIFGGLVGAGLGILSSIAAPSAREVGEQAGLKLPITNAVASRQIIYGEMRVGGSEVFIEEYNTFESDRGRDDDIPNDALIYVRAVADHPIDGFVSYHMGDREIRFDTSKSQNLENGGNAIGDLRDCLYLSEHDGTQTLADRKLTSVPTLGWGAGHVGRGIAYFTVRAQFDQDKYPYGPSEIRNLRVQVRGKRIYDPRLDSTRIEIGGDGPQRLGDTATWAYSQNPALVIYDFLRDDTLGNAVPDDEIDISSIVDAANIADERVPVKSGGTIPRYTFNGVIDGNRDKYANISSMLSAMSGRIMWLGGKVHIFAAYPDMETERFQFDEDNVFAAQLLPLPPIERRYNEVRGTFLSPEDGFEPQDFPPVVDAAAQAEEGAVVFNLNLPFTHDHREAQRLAQIALRQARQPMLRLEAQPIGAAFAPMDVVAVSWRNLGVGFSGGPSSEVPTPEDFRITEQSISGGQGGQPMRVQLGLTREDASIYAWDAAVDEKDRNIPVTLRQPTGLEMVEPQGVTASPTTIRRQDNSEVAALSVSWETPLSLVSETYVDVRPADSAVDAAWIPISTVNRFESDIIITLPENTVVEVRVRHKLLNGMISTPVIVTATTDDVGGDGGGITWATLGGEGKPSDFADVTADNQVVFGRLWDFNNNALGWTAIGGTLDNSFGLMTITATSADHQLISPSGLGIRGSEFGAIVLRVARKVGGSVDFEETRAFYQTAGPNGHDFDAGFFRRAPRRFEQGVFTTFVFDMENLTQGGSDWQDSIIDRIRIDLSETDNDAFDIDYIGIARIGVGDVVDGNGVNLIPNAYPTITDASDTDDESQLVVEPIANLGLEAGDIISASMQIRAPDARAGTLVMRFFGSGDTKVGEDFTSIPVSNQAVFETVRINGIEIPAGAERVRLLMQRSDGVSGVVVGRRPALNIGSRAFAPTPVRPDIEEGATRTLGRGEYQAGIEYKKGDVVTYEGSSYLFIGDTAATGSTPPNANWQTLSERGQSITVEYAPFPNGPWDSTFGAEDLFMRQRIGDGAFSAAIRIVGEEGGATDYRFRRDLNTPSRPSDAIPSGWFDQPPSGVFPLWMIQARKRPDGSFADGATWSTPVRLTGEDGADGTNGPTYAGLINNRGGTGIDRNTIYFCGYTDGAIDIDKPARIARPDAQGQFFEFGGVRGQTSAALSESSLLANTTGSNGTWYVVVETNGTRPFVNRVTTNFARTHAAIAKRVNGEWVYDKFADADTPITVTPSMVIIGQVDRFRDSEGGEGFLEFIPFYSSLAAAPSIGAPNTEHIPATSLGGTYTLEPIAPARGVDAGSSATIHVDPSTLYLGGREIAYLSGNIPGLAFSTYYHVYAIDPHLNGRNVQYLAITDRTMLPEGHIYFGLVRTPANGGSTTGGTPGGFGGGGGAYDPTFIYP